MGDGRGHQLLWSLLVLLVLLKQQGERLAWSRDQSHLRRCLETSRETLRLPSALNVLLQSPKSLQVLPLKPTVLAYPDWFHTGLGHPFVEGRPGEAAVQLNLADWVAVERGGICHGDGKSVDVSGGSGEMSLDIRGHLP